VTVARKALQGTSSTRRNATFTQGTSLGKKIKAAVVKNVTFGLAKHLDITIETLEPGHCVATMRLQPEKHLAANGFLHGGSVVSLADTTCGYGTFVSLPDDCHNFCTMELKTNFLGTTTQGVVRCEGHQIHSGRSTQVWDAKVFREDGTCIALFRCTQMHLYPNPNNSNAPPTHPPQHTDPTN